MVASNWSCSCPHVALNYGHSLFISFLSTLNAFSQVHLVFTSCILSFFLQLMGSPLLCCLDNFIHYLCPAIESDTLGPVSLQALLIWLQQRWPSSCFTVAGLLQKLTSPSLVHFNNSPALMWFILNVSLKFSWLQRDRAFQYIDTLYEAEQVVVWLLSFCWMQMMMIHKLSHVRWCRMVYLSLMIQSFWNEFTLHVASIRFPLLCNKLAITWVYDASVPVDMHLETDVLYWSKYFWLLTVVF